MRIILSLIAAMALLIAPGVVVAEEEAPYPHKGLPDKADTVYAFTAKSIDGEEVDLAKYKGKVLLIVNTASKCGFTPQYEGLQELYDKYKDNGLVVLGFPSNDFGKQEPGSNAEIKAFCSTNYGVSFPMFAKTSVKGDDIHPLYKWLTSTKAGEGDISWNFNKFLIGTDGKVVERFGSMTGPGSRRLEKRLLPLLDIDS